MPRRISVKGTPGSGKTTFAAELARRLALTCIELDELHWGPNWSVGSTDEFRTRVHEAMAASPDGWVIDGNYDSKLGDTVTSEADTIVWLDLPLPLKLHRVWQRTLHRIRDDVELWHGNRETWRGVIGSRDSLVLWTIRTHRRHRRQWPVRFAGDPRLVRLRSTAAASRWLDEQTRN
jgi:adenylate kinase family enzyme